MADIRVAELELTIPCKSTPCRYGMATMAILMPVWAIITPFCLGLFTSLVLKEQERIPALAALVVFAVLISIPIISIMLAAIFEDDVLVVSKDGIAFPLRMLPALGFRRERHWSDIKSAMLSDFGDESNPKRKGTLSLFFKSGGYARIKLDKIPEKDLEQLFLALELWGADCERSEELKVLQNRLQNESRGLEALTYTQMWEEELSRKFSSTSFVPLEPGQELNDGHVKVVRQLAFGGLSAIYLVQKDDSQMFVLKEAVVPANANDAARSKAEELFEREAKFLISLSHEQIAKVHDHFKEDGRSYLLMDYIRGQDLRQLVKQNGKQDSLTVMKWGEQIAQILSYLHSQEPPVVHRDLTPDNLVLSSDNKVFLIDFGAANEFVGTATGTLVGKQAYIAPEQLRGKAEVKSDIYGLGGTLSFLLTGEDPEALSAANPKEKNESVPNDLNDLIAACTDMEARNRPATADDIAQNLSSLIEKYGEESATVSG